MINDDRIIRDENQLILHENRPETALLISVYQGTKNLKNCEEHLDELALLVKTYGMIVADKQACPIRKFDASTFLGKGKVNELVQRAQVLKVDRIIFDDEISPAQQRNLESLFCLRVMDRTEVILAVFGQRAQTKEAHLQIKLAEMKYNAPRLKRMWSHLSRQQGTGSAAGGGAYLRGEGEKQIEIDRRILKNTIDQLNNEIAEIRAIRETQRLSRQRSEIPIFAIIGYTNAGKSTLLNALTDAGVFVEDKLFATLDTTTRKFTLKNNQEILLIDTVGFIRKLPHLLVAAFKSTLEESTEADILLHIIDASHPMAVEQAQATYEVLKELKAENKSIITVFNKIDKCQDSNSLIRLKMTYPKNVCISALNHEGFDELQEAMIKEISFHRKIVDLRISQQDYGVVSEIRRLGRVLSQDYENNDVIIKADLPFLVANKFQSYIIKKI